jgi:uncharacterized RDD family membrane protein YckC
LVVEVTSDVDISASRVQENSAVHSSSRPARDSNDLASQDAWRGELASRLQAYRVKRRKVAPSAAQSAFSFEAEPAESSVGAAVGVEAPVRSAKADDDDFSFTIAIGRNAATRQDPRMLIDVSLPPNVSEAAQPPPLGEPNTEQTGQFPAASIEERRLAGLIDTACLLFAYGGFLALFGSLGGQFTFSKLSAAVCVTTFVIVYLQYFALFTVFGGTTPGMMLRGLHVVSFSGEPPAPRQMLWRSLGYMLSAGTFFMGFLWAIWDEDGLTWHDRLSHTYLCPAPTFADIDATHAAQSR